jgi:hypothetical protein
MSLDAERVGPRRRLRSILAGHADEEMARAFATYHTELAALLGDPAATMLSKRGQDALVRIRERTLATRSAIAKVQPRIHEADVLLRALASCSERSPRVRGQPTRAAGATRPLGTATSRGTSSASGAWFAWIAAERSDGRHWTSSSRAGATRS